MDTSYSPTLTKCTRRGGWFTAVNRGATVVFFGQEFSLITLPKAPSAALDIYFDPTQALPNPVVGLPHTLTVKVYAIVFDQRIDVSSSLFKAANGTFAAGKTFLPSDPPTLFQVSGIAVTGWEVTVTPSAHPQRTIWGPLAVSAIAHGIEGNS